MLTFSELQQLRATLEEAQENLRWLTFSSGQKEYPDVHDRIDAATAVVEREIKTHRRSRPKETT